MRNKLSPAFTASKLKGMFPQMTKCACQFAKYLVSRESAESEPIEFKSTFTRLTNDIIASTAFGVETNAVQNPDEEFYKYAKNITNFGVLRSFLIMCFPKLMAALGVSFTPKKVTDYFKQIIKSTMEYREEKNISRPDMLQLLMAAQKGNLKKEVGEDVLGTIGEDIADSRLHEKHMNTNKGDSISISNEDIASQAFVFFFAGYESVATFLSFLAHELAENPEIQNQLQEEIDGILMQGTVSYESISAMKYLDMVVSECFRKYPPNPTTDRVCLRDFKIPNTDKVIEAGTLIYLPIYPLHRDPEYFPDPEKFDPERFSEENKGKIKPYTYLPFGVGPHNCLGMRFALLEVKLIVVFMLATCSLTVCDKTEIPLQLSKAVTMTTDNGFWLLAIPRENPAIRV
ncbi:cytochrome P450 9e2-like [Cloeon dipterum]|uniref:cytochrome P450 9e2-like n=1 Tax=Cloeon dipterum TaxID=197152 RepID=UPI0032203703